MERGRVADWFVPSIGDILFICILIWTLSHGVDLLADGDTGWHITTGQSIISTHRVPHADPYSYSMAGTPWTAHEWLAEVVFALLHRLAGLNGLVAFTCVLLSITFFWLYRYLLHLRVNILIAAVLSASAASVSMMHWLSRPHIFSFPLTLAFYAVLDMYQRGDRDRLWLLPPLMVVWVNLHGGYILGVILLLIYLGCNLVVSRLSGGEDEAAGRRARRLALFAGLVLLATFLNPQGPAILYFPFHLVGREYIMDNIMEWLSPNFHADKRFEYMLLFIATVFVLSRKKPSLVEGVTALFLTHISLYSVRYIPLFAQILTPAAAVRTEDALSALAEKAPRVKLVGRLSGVLRGLTEDITPLEERFGRHLFIYVSIALCALVALNGGWAGRLQLMDYRHDKGSFPVEALEFAVKNNIKGNVFNNDGWGGYIIYKYHDRIKVFFDGRSDMYGVPLMKEYRVVMKAAPGTEEVLDKYKVDWVIYNARSSLCNLLRTSGRWRLVYADRTAEIYLRDAPGNRALIDRYRYARPIPVNEKG